MKQQFQDDDPAFNEGIDSARKEMTDEIASVLQQLNHLAEVWGDEGVFRRCRDRLRKLITEDATK